MLFGRDDERDVIGGLLEGARASRSAALVVRGEPGVGKTALLDDTVARAADMHVLTAAGVESESDLPFAAMHQLLRPALAHLDALPDPQARALRSALGLADGAAPERFLVYAACLGVLSELAERRPVLCLVDDAQWLDTASSEGLQFVARRLDAEGIAMIFGAREGEARRFEAVGVPSLVLEGLDAEAAGALLSQVAGGAAPAVLEALLARTEGNALALVELPAALTRDQLAGTDPLPAALPMTRQLESLFHGRVARLSAGTRALLLVAAADDSEDLPLVSRAAARLGAAPGDLDEAERAGLVVVHGDRIRFRHPLVRSAVYGAATSGERRAAHGALADALDGDGAKADRRAWHLAAAALDQDDGVVRELDLAARRAEERGGQVSAALALERGAELTRDPAEQAERFVRAARDMSLAGRDLQAVAIAARATGLSGRPLLQAEVARVRSAAAIRRGRPADGVPELVAAATELADLAPTTAIELLMHATIAGWQGGGGRSTLEVAAVLETIPVDGMDAPSRVIARSIRGFASMIAGDAATAVPLLKEAVEWGAVSEEPRHVMWCSWAAVWLGDDARFEALLERSVQQARARGEIATLADVLGTRAVHLALFAQRFHEASIVAEEAYALGRELDADNILLLPSAALAIIAAVQGRDAVARDLGGRAVALARERGVRLRASPAVYALAMVEMAAGRWAEALAQLETLTDSADPAVALTAPDRIEAAVRAGHRDRAREVLTGYEQWAGYAGTAATRPRLDSCRALVTEGDEADRHLQEALRRLDDARPFDRARIRLLAGEYLRRQGHRVDAREHLRAAIGDLEEMGAEPWAERARVELRASGETARRRDPSTVPQLTAQERQIARLVAQGLTNKEVAAQLFLSPRTIDAHLRGVFTKVGISSRRELRGLAL